MDKIYAVRTSLRDILTVVFKYHHIVLFIFFTVVSTVTVISLLMPKVYEATSKVMVKVGRENVYMPTSPTMRENQPVLFDYSREERINSEVEILRGRNLIEKVISDLGVKKIYPDIDKKPLISNPFSRDAESVEKENLLFMNAVLVFMDNLRIEALRKSDIIDIRFQHNDPMIAAQVVNKLITEFLELHLNVYKKTHGYDFFDKQVSILKTKLQESEDEYSAFCRENEITSLDEQKSLLLQTISALEADLARTRTEIGGNEGKMEALRGNAALDIRESNMGEETELNPQTISAIKTRLNELRLEEENLLGRFTEKSIPVVNIRKEIAKAQKLLKTEEETYHDKAITSITHNLNALRKRELIQSAQLKTYQLELNRIKGLEIRLRDLQRKVTLNEDTYQLYVKNMEEARLSQAMDTQKIANISVVEPALPPIEPIKPKVLLNIALSIVLGGLTGILAALYREYILHSFNNREEVQKHLDLPVLASIPEFE